MCEKYLKKELLGNGGFAKCYLMVHVRTQEKLAGKVIRRWELRDKESRAKVMQESEIHKYGAHHLGRWSTATSCSCGTPSSGRASTS